MATFQAQVEGLTGLDISINSSPTRTEMTQFLKDGVVDVISKLVKTDRSAAMTLGVITSESGNGTIIDGEILDVWASDGTNDHPATLVPASIGKRSADPESLLYRSKYNPYYYREGKRVLVKPDGGSILHIIYPSVEYDQETIYNMPSQYIRLVVIYASAKSLGNALAAKTFPSDVSVPIMLSISTSLPTFEQPAAFVPPASLADSNVSFDLPDFPVFISPSVPSLSSSSVTLPTNIPSYIKPVSAVNYDLIDNYIDNQEDLELANTKLQEMNLKLQEHTANMQQEQSNFESQNTKYQAELQKAIQDAQLESQDDAQKISKYQAELQAELNRVQNSAQEYQQKVAKDLQQYQAETGYDVSKFGADLEAEVQKYTQNLAQNSTKFQSDLSKYQAEVAKVNAENQTEIQKFTSEVQKYTSEVQKAQADYQWMQGRQQVLLQEYYSAFAVEAPAQQQ